MNKFLKAIGLSRDTVEGSTSTILSTEMSYHGYVDELSKTHIVGWIRNPKDEAERVGFEVLVITREGSRIIGKGIADQSYPALVHSGVGDGKYGFNLIFSISIEDHELQHVYVRPVLAKTFLAFAPKFQGYIDEKSAHHVAGWVRNRFDSEDRVSIEVVVGKPKGDKILAEIIADQLNSSLALSSIGDAKYGFRILLTEPLTDDEIDTLVVRPSGTSTALPLSPHLVTTFEPIDHIALDIVNNCNLRCPFCLFDYSDVKTTKTMSNETFDAVLKLIPYVRDGNFWLSCLHEPTLNPDFLKFIEKIPRQWRRKVMFTTNLAKRMQNSYFTTLADSGIYFINISLESLNPEIFERMRKGARWNIFLENWDQLIDAWKAVVRPPRLRYIILAYRSNLAEIPSLVKFLRDERLAWQVEVRHTYKAPHISKDFCESEYLQKDDWSWLSAQLKNYTVDEVVLILPPDLDNLSQPLGIVPLQLEKDTPSQLHQFASAKDDTMILELTKLEPEPSDLDRRIISQPYNIQIEWDGKFVVYGKWENPPERKEFAITNINELTNPYQFLMSLLK